MFSLRMKRRIWVLAVALAVFGLEIAHAQSVDPLPLEIHRPHVSFSPTAGDGWFSFESIPSGEYWLAVKREGKEMAATVTLDLQVDVKGNCQEQGALIGEKYFTVFTHLELEIM
jgi:hypothetical protein